MRRKRPTDWREQVNETYLQEGQAIGRAIMYDNDREQEIWDLIGGLNLWPRWYLFAFATLYREANIPEYNRQKASRHYKKKSAATRSGTMMEARNKAYQESVKSASQDR